MNSRVFSVILLPTSACNVACDYCFEHKEPHRLSFVLVPLLTHRLLDHLEHEGIEECEIYWQGGEAMINVEDKDGRIVVASSDPIAGKYPVVRPLPEII